VQKKLIPYALVCCVFMQTTWCASMFSGTTSNVNVTSTPTGADCNVLGHGVHTPGNLVLEKTHSDLTINCQTEGYTDGTAKIISSFNTTSLFNILTLSGRIIGFIVDFSTGTAWEYTNQVNVNLVKNGK
jgi:hypothetical protein